MGDVAIFDSLTHPTPTGNWLEPRHDGIATATALVEQMQRHRVERALAVGMGETVGGYREADYAHWVRDAVPGAVPIAYLAFDEHDRAAPMSERMGHLRELGYRGVKVHPRRSAVTFADPVFREALVAAAELQLPVLVCSYNVGHPDHASGELGPAALMAAVDAAPGVRLVVLHGGVHDVLEWSEWVRPRPDVLLDLSFTMARYPASSVDLDIGYLFGALDQRLCVGSDHPQFDLATLRSRFEHFAASIPTDKAENIASRNLARFFPEGDR